MIPVPPTAAIAGWVGLDAGRSNPKNPRLEQEVKEPAVDFTAVTEIGGAEVSREQVERLAHRYIWAATFCAGKDVLEVACGSGQGLGLLAARAKTLQAGDISEELLRQARSHYGDRVSLESIDALQMPCGERSLDVVILFEALYYLTPAERFVEECGRVLRKGGTVLIATANKDLFDFSPSLYSNRYYGTVELRELFQQKGFEVSLFGTMPVTQISLRQRILRPVKKAVVTLGLMPKTMIGKKFLRRLVFGSLITMPPEIAEGMTDYEPPTPLDAGQPDRQHKVIYCAAVKAE